LMKVFLFLIENEKFVPSTCQIFKTGPLLGPKPSNRALGETKFLGKTLATGAQKKKKTTA